MASPTTDWWDTTMPPLSHPQVYESDPVKTGLLDADGRPLYRKTDPIGFVRFDGEKR